jgi:hypothetical protein
MVFFGAGILAGLVIGWAIEWAVDWSSLFSRIEKPTVLDSDKSDNSA